MALLRDALDGLSDLRSALEADGNIGAHVFLWSARGRDRREKWRRVSLAGNVASRFVDGARDAITELHVAAGVDSILTEFDFDEMATGSVGVIRASEAPSLNEWLDDVPDETWPVLYRQDDAYEKKIRFFCTRITFPDGRLLKFFRSRRGFDIILNTGNRIAAHFRPDSTEMQEVQGTIISFDQRIDFFVWDDILYVLNLPAFEALTNVREVTVSKASEAFVALTSRFGLANSAEIFAAISGRTKLAKKLAAAVQYGLISDIQGHDIVERIRTKELEIQCLSENGSFRFIVDENQPKHIEQFVDLITDVYLHSPVTRREWRAIVKRPA